VKSLTIWLSDEDNTKLKELKKLLGADTLNAVISFLIKNYKTRGMRCSLCGLKKNLVLVSEHKQFKWYCLKCFVYTQLRRRLK